MDKTVEVVIAAALEQIATDVTCVYGFLNRILKVISVSFHSVCHSDGILFCSNCLLTLQGIRTCH